ncbi:hypothetical protein SARC_02562 [Sphaeroforma arctica JP610]|uniref:Uncharacterized protein n=1 Tax=Sphaeroforma arctica JP610 TaxID=667725 RepID=A0A0L0G8Q8_9EUKA|nr:hypothetical protein SARC_02562 [Sphaeroforma arctica JP610]KNC85266.1 hypothetical protein SARC_02562 [Sphaeroforma arctica JP610]|eukprot:XP_014159168.1 hypothetical protein SARC_02562 [Sphaeroforma arctica JP610]
MGTESLLGGSSSVPLLRSHLKAYQTGAENEAAPHRAAAFLADQRDAELNTPSDGGRTAASGASAVPEPATLSLPIGQQDPTATQPDSGTSGASRNGGDGQPTEAEKAQWAQFQQDEAMGQRIRTETEDGVSFKVIASVGNLQQSHQKNGNGQKADCGSDDHGGKGNKGGGGQQQPKQQQLQAQLNFLIGRARKIRTKDRNEDCSGNRRSYENYHTRDKNKVTPSPGSVAIGVRNWTMLNQVENDRIRGLVRTDITASGRTIVHRAHIAVSVGVISAEDGVKEVVSTPGRRNQRLSSTIRFVTRLIMQRKTSRVMAGQQAQLRRRNCVVSEMVRWFLL